MINTVLSFFEFNLERLLNPGVSCGIIFMIISMIFVFTSDKLSKKLFEKTKKDTNLIIKCTAGVVFVISAIIAVVFAG